MLGMLTSLLIFTLLLLHIVLAKEECTEIIGQLQCERDSKKHNLVQISLMDEDWGREGLWSELNRDDRANTGLTDLAGRFEIGGCSKDPDFFWLTNLPDWYLHLNHTCNGFEQEVVIHFEATSKATKDFGVIFL